jgi:hypothetical protein
VTVEQTKLTIESAPPDARVAQNAEVRAAMLELMADAIVAVHRAHRTRERDAEEQRDDDART